MATPKISVESEAFLQALRKFERHLDTHDCKDCLSEYSKVMRLMKSTIGEIVFPVEGEPNEKAKKQTKNTNRENVVPEDDSLEGWD
jgi:hypothetical protein